jgi:hypothetical protein
MSAAALHNSRIGVVDDGFVVADGLIVPDGVLIRRGAGGAGRRMGRLVLFGRVALVLGALLRPCQGRGNQAKRGADDQGIHERTLHVFTPCAMCLRDTPAAGQGSKRRGGKTARF